MKNNDLTKIYTIMVMTELTIDKQTKFPEFGSSRLVGWYPEFEKARSIVSDNIYDLNETCYEYALIEECEMGVYNTAYKRWWFRYNRGKDSYMPIDEPDFVKHFGGFTIG